MSGTYRAKGGETWNLVARVATGDDINAAKIQRANPGVPSPIPAGTLLQIPSDDIEPSFELLDDIRITVDGQQVGTFNELEVGLSVDAITKAAFTVPNEPETRAIFKPLSAPRITIMANREVLLTGRCESPAPTRAQRLRTLSVTAYSHPGILERCHPPLSAFPLEWTNANLLQISKDLCLFHGINCDFRADSGPLFERVDIRPGGAVLDFLTDLARQRGPVLSSSPEGRLVVWNGVAPGGPVAKYVNGVAPVDSVSVAFDESKYYSSVTGWTPAKTKRRGKKDKGRGAEFTVQNPFATDQVRPFEAEFPDIDAGELETAVNTMAGRMFADIVSVNLEVAGWKDDHGSLLKPNTTVMLTSEEDFIPKPYEFLVADVSLKQSSQAQTASLRLTLPGVYSGEIPEVMPWQ